MNRTRFAAACLLAASGLGARADDPPKADPPPAPTAVRSLAFSPDGKVLIAAAGKKDQPGELVAWDADTRKPRWRRSAAEAFGSVSFAPDGKSVAVAHGKATALRLDPLTGKELGEVGPHPTTVRACVHLPGTGLLATGSDGTIRLWDLKTGRVVKELTDGHPAEVTSLVVSPDAKWLVSTGPDGTRGWDVAAGTELKDAIKLQRGIGWYGVVFVAPDRVLYADNSATQHLVELPSGKEVMRYKGYGRATVLSRPLGLAANTWHGPGVSVMDLNFRPPTADEAARVGKLLKEFDDDSYDVRVAASKAMKAVGSVAEPLLRAAASDGPSAEVRVRAREARRAILEEPLRTLKGHTADVRALAFSPDGTVLASGGDDGTVRLWDPRTGKELARLDVPPVKDGGR